MSSIIICIVAHLAMIITSQSVAAAVDQSQEDSFPVKPVVLVDGKFQRCEGICFNGEGDLYVTGNHCLWRVSLDGEVEKVAEMYTNLGIAPIGERDLLVADFGPTNVFNHGENDDGIVWRITPDGDKSVVATGIADPNFVLLLRNGSFLVSDDGTNKIYIVDSNGAVKLFTDSINHPNGMVLSLDGKSLYVAQIFKRINPVVPDNHVWRLPMKNGQIAGPPEVYAAPGKGGHDGLAMDSLGRVYVASNGEGKILRIELDGTTVTVIAEDIPGVASLAFGEGDFDHQAIYATSPRSGKVVKVNVGISGAPVQR